jgi:hypothetical protein
MTNAHERITLPPISSFDLSPSRKPHARYSSPSSSRRPPRTNGSPSWEGSSTTSNPPRRDFDPPDDARYELGILDLGAPYYSQCFAPLLILFQTITKHIRRPQLRGYERTRARKALPLLRARWPHNAMRAPAPLSSTTAQQQCIARPRPQGPCRTASILFPVSSLRAAAHVRPLKVPPISRHRAEPAASPRAACLLARTLARLARVALPLLHT